MPMSIVELGTVVGLFPTVSMLLTSALTATLLTHTEIDPKWEAFFQNFCAGLIIAAVAQELFPLLHEGTTRNESIIGISIGFVVSLLAIHALEALIEHFEGESESEKDSFIAEKEYSITALDDSEDGIIMTRRARKNVKWEESPIQESLKAILHPEHKSHIKEHLEELQSSLAAMESQSDRLMEKNNFTTEEIEAMAEAMDEEIHKVQYKLDHARRLLQGSENKMSGGSQMESSWVTDEKKQAMRSRLLILKESVSHLIEHINEDDIDLDVIKEMHGHMDEMDTHISHFHASVENSFSKWRKSRQLMMPEVGATVPTGLVSPVMIDASIDGVLIGISCALNYKAGWIMGFANVFEMGILGIAYTVRISKCTGSSLAFRFLCIIAPPIAMLVLSALGALIGHAVIDQPIIYVALVSFGIVAYLFLVCNELIIEAKNAQGDEERWWIGVMIFVGIYVVLIMDSLMPE